MKETKIKILINRKQNEVFDFITNPENTPKWIPGIEKEVLEKFPPEVGTKYVNTEFGGKQNSYVVTTYVHPEVFQLDAIDFDYKLKYSCKEVGPNVTEFEYHEWSDSGNLHSLEMESILQNLKNVVESE